jgi:hypothetical protein
MLYQYENKTTADWQPEKASLSSVRLNGNISSEEKAFRSYDVVFGGGYNAKVYTRANATHIYYGIEMAEYVFSDDALGIQLAPRGLTSNSDIHIVGYGGNPYYDGHVDYSGEWAADVSGANATRYAAGAKVVEFLLPLQNRDVQDLYMAPGMNYEIRLLFWNNIKTGEPTFASSWKTFWVPVDLY